jgi:hypothetical protein
MGYFRAFCAAVILVLLAIPAAASPINMLTILTSKMPGATGKRSRSPVGSGQTYTPPTRPATCLMPPTLYRAARGGLVQVFLPWNTCPDELFSSVWVYVNSGQVGMGVGNGGDTGFDVTSQFTGRWERLFAKNGLAPANEFIVYGSNGADFVVTQPHVGAPLPEPDSLYLFATGLTLAILLLGRYTRQRGAKAVHHS